MNWVSEVLGPEFWVSLVPLSSLFFLLLLSFVAWWMVVRLIGYGYVRIYILIPCLFVHSDYFCRRSVGFYH